MYLKIILRQGMLIHRICGSPTSYPEFKVCTTWDRYSYTYSWMNDKKIVHVNGVYKAEKEGRENLQGTLWV